MSKKIDLIVKNGSYVTHKKTIKGDVKAYGIITGDFSMNDFDVIIENAQTDLIIILSRDLKSKI